MVAQKGQKAGVVTKYGSAHERVSRLKGRPSTHKCPCGEAAKDWAYLGGDPEELTDSEHGCKFSLDINLYVALCRSCHRLMDNAHITRCPQGHEYVEGNIYWEVNRSGNRTRICRQCRCDKKNARNKAKRTPTESRSSMKKIAVGVVAVLAFSLSACTSDSGAHSEYITKGQTATVKVTCS